MVEGASQSVNSSEVGRAARGKKVEVQLLCFLLLVGRLASPSKPDVTCSPIR